MPLERLTKVFVVLLVIVSLQFVAGVVVFVNKVENYSKQADTYKAAAATATAAAAAERLKSNQVIAEKEAATVEANNRANALASANQSLQSSIATLQTSLATTTAAKAVVDTQITTLTNALKEAQDAIKAQERR